MIFRGEITPVKSIDFQPCVGVIPSLKLTAKASENGWLEDFLVSFRDGLFSGAFWLVSGRVYHISKPTCALGCQWYVRLGV